MKQQKFFVIVITVCALLLTLVGCASSSAFDGSSAKNADSYHLDVKTMNGTDTHTLELKQGDTLKILFETVKGSLEMKITSPDGTSLYQGDGTVTEFTVEAPVDGPYAIVVVGQKAKGSIHVDVKKCLRSRNRRRHWSRRIPLWKRKAFPLRLPPGKRRTLPFPLRHRCRSKIIRMP